MPGSRRARFFVRLLAINVLIASAILVAFSDVGRGMPWTAAAVQFALNFLVSLIISSLCMAALPPVTRYVFPRVPAAAAWAAVVVVLFGLAAGGSLLFLSLLALVGYIRARDIVDIWLGSSLRVSVVITLAVGVFVTAAEMLRARLDQVTIALRTKERDEAEARRLVAEAHRASLESRVQPHFLFNTLNSIAALIPQDPEGAERMTAQLASLLRSSLSTTGGALVPLEQELQIVRNYLDIERVRFGERLRYDITVDAAAREALVPPLSIQTLVENSVKYAVAPRREGGTIAIRARAADDVMIQVSDDGPGFDGTRIPEGHGLSLLRDRLRIALGGRATLDIDGRPGAATVTIAIPPGAAA